MSTHLEIVKMALPHDFSSLNLSQDSIHQSLSHSFTVAELLHQAPRTKLTSKLARVKGIYGRSLFGTPNTSSKSTMRLNATYSRIPSRLITDVRKKSVKPEPPPPRKVPSARFLSDIRLTTETCKSDFFELRRDIATYEHAFLHSHPTLPDLDTICQFAPEVACKSQEANVDREQTVSDFHSAIVEISRLTGKGIPLQGEKCFQKVEFDLKKPSDHYRMRTVLTGSRVLSGTHCLIRVRSNGWLTSFEIRALMVDGTPLHLTLSHSIPGLCSDFSSVDTARRLEMFLLQKLYLTVTHDEVSLSFSPQYGLDFYEFPVFVKGRGVVLARVADCTLVLPQVDDVPVTAPVKISELKSLISRHLRYDASKSQLVWQDAQSRFRAKESDSKYMNTAYVTEKLGSFVNRHSFVTECVVQGFTFAVELHTRGHREKVVITGTVGAKEVKDMKFLRSLQFAHLTTSWTTLMRSLELQVTIRKLFPELFN